MKALIVDDDRVLADVLAFTLRREGFEVIQAHDGETALDRWAEHQPDLVVLDVNMPRLDGFAVCRQIREYERTESHADTPIILLTVRGEEDDIVHGLGLGADDYITKPFSARELLARIRATMRRHDTPSHKDAPTYETGELFIDFMGHRVFVREQEVKLAPTEYRLLSELAKQANRILVPDYLLEKVWGMGHEGEVQLLWQAIHRLRHKIEDDPQNPIYIQTRPGIGYIFTEPEKVDL